MIWTKRFPTANRNVVFVEKLTLQNVVLITWEVTYWHWSGTAADVNKEEKRVQNRQFYESVKRRVNQLQCLMSWYVSVIFNFDISIVQVKLQILNLAMKLCLTNPKQTKLLSQYVFNLAKYDTNYDIRDR